MELGELTVAANTVLQTLGGGLPESLYKQALAYELRSTHGKIVDLEAHIPVRYRGAHIGCIHADMLVGGEVLVEVKAVTKLSERDTAQLGAYLSAFTAQNGGEPTVGYLVNVGLYGKLPAVIETVTGV